MSENLHNGGTRFAGKLCSDRLAIGQATLLNSYLDQLVRFESFLGGIDDIATEVVLADHDIRLQAMAKAAQEPVLFPGQLHDS